MSLSDDERDYLNRTRESVPATPEVSLDNAMQVNPDRHANVIDIATRRELPIPVVEEEFEELERRDRRDQFDPSTFGPSLMQYLKKPDNAMVSHDDIENLKAIEQELAPRGSVKRQIQDIGQNLGDIASSLGSGVFTLSSGAYGLAEQATDILRFLATERLVDAGVIPADPLKPASEFFRARRQEGEALAEGMLPRTGSETLDAVYQGLQSAGANIPAMLSGMWTRNAAHALGIMVGSVEGRSYGTGKDQGLSVSGATAYGIADGMIEYYTEKMPIGRLIEDLGLNRPFKEILWTQLKTEVPQEQLATLLQDLNAWAFLPENKDQTFSDYLKERPAAALHTLIATAVGTSVQTGVTYGIQQSAHAISSRNDDAIVERSQVIADSRAEQSTIDNLITLAQSSKTNERAAEQFKEFLQGAGSDKFIYVPAEIVETLAVTEMGVPQSMLDQLDGLGSDVAIPMDEFMADVAVNENMMEILRPHLKMGEDRLSMEELEKGQDMQIRALLERAQANAQALSESEQIWSDVRDQLMATGRLTQTEAKLSASLIPAFAVVKAEEQGRTVQEVWGDMRTKIFGPQAPVPEGQHLTQDFDEIGEGVTGENVGFNSQRISGLLNEYGYADDRVIAAVVKVNPQDFVAATTPGKAGREFIEQDTKPLDVEKLRGEGQTPMLRIEETDGEWEITGHEGRHRLQALANAGFTSVPVVMYNRQMPYDNRTMGLEEGMVVRGQPWPDGPGDPLTISNPVDISYDNVDLLREVHGTGDLMFQPRVAGQQDLGDLELTEEVEVEGTGETVTIRQEAQRAMDQLMKRRNVVNSIRGCLGAA